MDAHEKLGNLLSEYLSSQDSQKSVPQDVLDAFHLLGLTEFASRKNVDETWSEKCAEIERDKLNSPSSRFASDYAAQQKKELDDAHSLIVSFLENKA